MRDAALPFGARNTVPASVVYTQFVTVQAFPDIFVWSPVFAPLTVVVPVTANVGVALPDIATVLYFHAVMSPVVSAIVAALFCINLPVVLSNRAIALSVAEAGQTTSQLPLAVLAIVTTHSDQVPVVVSVMLAPSTSCTLHPVAERVIV